jgi:hypothetical protein
MLVVPDPKQNSPEQKKRGQNWQRTGFLWERMEGDHGDCYKKKP